MSRGLAELELFDSFPEGYEPNDAQKYIIEEIGAALDAGKKFIIINAPTATGKSFIAKTIANYSLEAPAEFVSAVESYAIFDNDASFDEKTLAPWGTAILTVTKNLQDQYIEMFEDGDSLKGKANYPCSIMDGYSCEDGMCVYMPKQLKSCIGNECCPYYNQRKKAVTNKCAFYNYSMFNKLHCNVKNKEFIICDEASELEQELVKQNTFELYLKDLGKIDPFLPPSPGIGEKNNAYYKWIQSLFYRIEELHNNRLSELGKEFKVNKKKKKLTNNEKKELNNLFRYKEMTKSILEVWNDTEYIIKREHGKIVFQPYNVEKIANYIFKHGKTIILMSATIVNHELFARTLGIKDYHYIEAKMTLEAEKAPIKCTNQFKLNYRNKAEVLPLMCHAVEAICERHKNQKGIIHTHSMDVISYVKKYVKNQDRFLYREEGVTNEQILEAHKNTDEPTILVSPSMTHGVDLKGKLGEFQIIMKAPYLPLSDERIKKKFEEDKEWYLNAMVSTLIQMCGRCNRTAEDYSVTYILDGNILDALRRYSSKLPRYFIERFS